MSGAAPSRTSGGAAARGPRARSASSSRAASWLASARSCRSHSSNRRAGRRTASRCMGHAGSPGMSDTTAARLGSWDGAGAGGRPSRIRTCSAPTMRRVVSSKATRGPVASARRNTGTSEASSTASPARRSRRRPRGRSGSSPGSGLATALDMSAWLSSRGASRDGQCGMPVPFSKGVPAGRHAIGGGLAGSIDEAAHGGRAETGS